MSTRPEPLRSSTRVRQAEEIKKKKLEEDALRAKEAAKRKAAKRRNSTDSGSDKENEKKKVSKPKKSRLNRDSVASTSSGIGSEDSSSPSNKRGRSQETQPEKQKKKKPRTRSPSLEIIEEPYIKYDVLPDKWIEEGWCSKDKPKTIPTEELPVLHSPRKELIKFGPDGEGRVEVREPRAVGVDIQRKSKKTISMVMFRDKSPHEYTQLIHAIQSFVYMLNDVSSNQFLSLVRKVDEIAHEMEQEKKSKRLNLYEIFIDMHLYKLFSSMVPNEECGTHGIYTRKVFEMLAGCVEEHFKTDESEDPKINEIKKKTKQEMIEIITHNNCSLQMYGEKMVIPCCRIEHHMTLFMDRILEESRKH